MFHVEQPVSQSKGDDVAVPLSKRSDPDRTPPPTRSRDGLLTQEVSGEGAGAGIRLSWSTSSRPDGLPRSTWNSRFPAGRGRAFNPGRCAPRSGREMFHVEQVLAWNRCWRAQDLLQPRVGLCARTRMGAGPPPGGSTLRSIAVTGECSISASDQRRQDDVLDLGT